MHICVSKPNIIGSDIIRINAGILLIGSFGTNLSEILIGIQTLLFKKMHLKMLSAKCRPFCLGLNVLTHNGFIMMHECIIESSWFRQRLFCVQYFINIQ